MLQKNALWLFPVFALNLVDQPAPDVTIEQGTLTGKISSDGTFYEYLGIPYGTVNKTNRFQAPYPPPLWKGKLRAVEEHHSCPQMALIGTQGQEDCLKVNVYVPVKSRKPLPVMVYIHGGAFYAGSGGQFLYAPDFLMKKRVIVVTFNYRLGVLGFLCLHIKEAPGNAGLRDQVAALRWVKKNIAAFGGDPDNITIFGESAGAASTSHMVATRATEGLFKRAIMSSGTSTAYWSINRKPIESASVVARHFGHETDDPNELFKIISNLPLEELVKARLNKPLGMYSETELLHIPCVEKTFPGTEPIIDDLPYNLIKNHPKNISVIHGTNSKEAFFLLLVETGLTLKHRNKQFAFSSDLNIPDKNTANYLSQKIKYFYFGNETISKNNLLKLLTYMTDLGFEMPAIFESELFLSVNKIRKVYNYYFDYSGERNLVKMITGYGNETGAAHGDDLFYVFKAKVWPFPVSKDDQQIINYITTMWTNFAKYDDPTPVFDKTLPVQWKPSSKGNMQFLYIDREMKMGPIPKPASYELWKDLYDKYRKTTYF